MIPNYHIYGYGDLGFLDGEPVGRHAEPARQLGAVPPPGQRPGSVRCGRSSDGERSGWHDRFQTWTWRGHDTAIPVLKLTKNVYRSHNTMAEESPLMWDFLKHYSSEVDGDGNVVRYYSRSGFRRSLGQETTLSATAWAAIAVFAVAYTLIATEKIHRVDGRAGRRGRHAADRGDRCGARVLLRGRGHRLERHLPAAGDDADRRGVEADRRVRVPRDLGHQARPRVGRSG